VSPIFKPALPASSGSLCSGRRPERCDIASVMGAIDPFRRKIVCLYVRSVASCVQCGKSKSSDKLLVKKLLNYYLIKLTKRSAACLFDFAAYFHCCRLTLGLSIKWET
jgi:hypothetical protein